MLLTFEGMQEELRKAKKAQAKAHAGQLGHYNSTSKIKRTVKKKVKNFDSNEGGRDLFKKHSTGTSKRDIHKGFQDDVDDSGTLRDQL